MFAKKSSFLIIFCVFLYCESAFVDTIKKCGIADEACQKKLLQSILRGIGKTGIPEFGIPPIDPFDLKNVSVTVLGLVEIGIVDGVAKGAKDCVVNRFDTHVEEERSTMEMTCDLTIKGKYKAFGSGPLIKQMLGGSTIRGDGLAKVVLEKVHMKFDYHFYIRERDGELYIDCQYKDLKYEYSIGKARFAANNLFIGDQDASATAISLLNDNWKFVLDTFGKPFLDKAMDIVYTETHKFFDVVPVKYYITDDLTPYIKKD